MNKIETVTQKRLSINGEKNIVKKKKRRNLAFLTVGVKK